MKASIKRQRGFSLMEGLITIVVLSGSLLGLAFLQALGIKFNHNAYNRSQATIASYELIDRVRVSGLSTISAEITDYTVAPTESEVGSCNLNSGSNVNDRNCWYQALRVLPNGNGDINVNGTDFQIDVAWLDRFAASNTTIDTQTECEAVNRIWSTSLSWFTSYPAPNPAVCMQTQTWTVRL